MTEDEERFQRAVENLKAEIAALRGRLEAPAHSSYRRMTLEIETLQGALEPFATFFFRSWVLGDYNATLSMVALETAYNLINPESANMTDEHKKYIRFIHDAKVYPLPIDAFDEEFEDGPEVRADLIKANLIRISADGIVIVNDSR